MPQCLVQPDEPPPSLPLLSPLISVHAYVGCHTCFCVLRVHVCARAGPLGRAFLKRVRDCATSQCSGHGRCTGDVDGGVAGGVPLGEGGGVDAGGTDDLKGFSFNVRTLTATGGNSRKRARRLAQELSDLISSLPLSLGSSVWVRSLDGRMDCMQLAISGPEDTPYSNGLFFFDVFFPARYPEAPPQVSHCLDIIFSPTLANLALLCTVLLRLPAITISISTNHRLTHCFFPALGLGTHHHHWIWYSALQSQPVQQRESLSVTPWHMGRWRRRILECRH